MYRVIAVAFGALTLAACSSGGGSSGSSSWFNVDALKPAPLKDSVTMESNPPGAQAKASTGETCTTPCALSLPMSGPLSVTFTLAGHVPETEQIELVSMGDGSNRLQPNPVSVELTAAAPAPKKPAPRKPAPRKPVASKPPAPAPAAVQTAPAAPAPAPAATTAAAPATSPWPAPAQPTR